LLIFLLYNAFSAHTDNWVINGGGSECYESERETGIAGRVSNPNGGDLDNLLLVWDEDAPCGNDDESYIHYSGSSNAFQAMSAGSGETVHTYRAAVFPYGFPVPPGTSGCYPFSSKTSTEWLTCLKKWKVARHGTSCPAEHSPKQKHLPVPRAFFVMAFIVFSIMMVSGLGIIVCRKCNKNRQKNLNRWLKRHQDDFQDEDDSGGDSKVTMPTVTTGGEIESESNLSPNAKIV
jgi:hypothetical protein